MENHNLYYDTITRLTTAISQSKTPEEVALLTAKSVKTAFKAKGCCVFLLDRDTSELNLVASAGLSQEYLSKGPTYFKQAINEAKDAVPIAIYDVMDDPRIQYPNEAKKKGSLHYWGCRLSVITKLSGRFAYIPPPHGNFPRAM